MDNLKELKDKFVKFESINIKRANAVAKRYMNNEIGISRAEIILTDTCNLKCVYCQKRKNADEHEERVDKEVLKHNIRTWGKYGCKFLHITGGECTLVPYLSELIITAKQHGMEISISTNGTNDIELYRELIKSGVNGFHISLDTNNCDLFDDMVGKKGSFNKVIETINLISELRDKEGYDLSLTLNTCITPKTLDILPEMLSFLLSLRPSDIKLIPIAQLKNEWPKLKDKYYNTIYPKIESMIPKVGFSMLRSRAEILVKPCFRGYDDNVLPSTCYLMGDERTVDPLGNYYGCYINYREGGEKIGNILTDNIFDQTRKLKLKASKLEENSICKSFCADITVLCNSYIEQYLQENNITPVAK